MKTTFSKEKTTTSPMTEIYKALQGMSAEEIHIKGRAKPREPQKALAGRSQSY